MSQQHPGHSTSAPPRSEGAGSPVSSATKPQKGCLNQNISASSLPPPTAIHSPGRSAPRFYLQRRDIRRLFALLSARYSTLLPFCQAPWQLHLPPLSISSSRNHRLTAAAASGCICLIGGHFDFLLLAAVTQFYTRSLLIWFANSATVRQPGQSRNAHSIVQLIIQ